MTCEDHGGKAPRYAACRHNGRYIGKHVRALMQKTGESPNGRYALHVCHNCRCINPDHLYWGDQRRNIKDAVEAGRHDPSRKLTEQQVSYVLENYKPYDRHTGGAALGIQLNVCEQTITKLVRNGGY